LIGFVDLHLEGGACMPGVETNDFQAKIAEFVYEPWRHRSGLDPDAGVLPPMPTHHDADLFWNRGALAPPQFAPARSTTQMAVTLCETSSPTKQVIDEI
jgi:hypothetical protein